MSLTDSYLKDYESPLTSDLESRLRYSSRMALKVLQVPPEAISPDGKEWLHCVEVTKDKISKTSSLIRIRVITNTHRGVNITVRCNSPLMNMKYLDLRFQVRNSDEVWVTFPELYITASHLGNRELYLTATDFKIYKSETSNVPTPTLII